MPRSRLVDPREREDEARSAHTSDVHTRKETRLVRPWEDGDEDRAENVGDEVDDAGVCEPVLPSSGNVDTSPDCHDFDDTLKRAR